MRKKCVIHMKDFEFYNDIKKKESKDLDRLKRFMINKYYRDDSKIIYLLDKAEIYRNNKYVRYEYKIRMIDRFEDSIRRLDIHELHRFISRN